MCSGGGPSGADISGADGVDTDDGASVRGVDHVGAGDGDADVGDAHGADAEENQVAGQQWGAGGQARSGVVLGLRSTRDGDPDGLVSGVGEAGAVETTGDWVCPLDSSVNSAPGPRRPARHAGHVHPSRITRPEPRSLRTIPVAGGRQICQSRSRGPSWQIWGEASAGVH